MRFLLVLLCLTACETQMAQTPSPSPRRDINAVLADHDDRLLAISGVAGIYVGLLDDERTPCLRVMLARDTPELRAAIPKIIEGYPVTSEVTGEIRPLPGRKSQSR